MSKKANYKCAKLIFYFPTKDGRCVSFSSGVRNERTWKAGSSDSIAAAAKEAKMVGAAIEHSLGAYEDVSDNSIEYDIEEICEHCGSRWTENSDDYNGGCCAADQNSQEFRETTGIAALEKPT